MAEMDFPQQISPKSDRLLICIDLSSFTANVSKVLVFFASTWGRARVAFNDGRSL